MNIMAAARADILTDAARTGGAAWRLSRILLTPGDRAAADEADAEADRIWVTTHEGLRQ